MDTLKSMFEGGAADRFVLDDVEIFL